MRKFKTHNDLPNVFIGQGTHLQGYITCTYQDIVKAFGEPNESDGYKSDAGWDIKWDDGTVSTIYNWKNGDNYNNDGTRTESIVEWNVGGKNPLALHYVLRAIKRSSNGHKSREQLEWMMDSLRKQTGMKI